MPRPKSETIRNYILASLLDHPEDIATVTAEHFGVTRQAINRHLKSLENDGLLFGAGRTRNRIYRFTTESEQTFWFEHSKDVTEDQVWARDMLPMLRENKRNVVSICQHGSTEMINNVLEHSETERFHVKLIVSTGTITIDVADEGVGIFRKIQAALNLDDPRHATLELAKGKFTTDPVSHTGEGIFFTSRMCDRFVISSGRISFGRIMGQDWLLADEPDEIEGTTVRMVISRFTDRTTVDVFSQYSSEFEEYGFTRTHVPVRLAAYEGDVLVSRSQARRLLARFERFKEVLLDFEGVETIGPAFADEIFRVYANEHPGTLIMDLNANKEVEKMIRRALAAKAAQ